MTKNSGLNHPGIYTITCASTGKIYVGQALNLRKRWGAHRWHLDRGLHGNVHLQRAWIKYGSASFSFAVARDLSNIEPALVRAALAEAEIAVLSGLKDTFNLMVVGQETFVASPETRAIKRQQQTERWADPHQRRALVEAMRKKASDADFQERRGEAISRGKSTEAARAQTSLFVKSLWASEEHRADQSAKRRANWSDPNYRAQQQASRSATWTDPEVRERRIAGLKAAHARKKAAGLPWKAST